ncbi:putative alcohol dehydrogenase cytochrome c subunit protein [Bradyrhizobium sp. ORS 278]|uniref:cytochrome c n=1 Tax=Bradyrhizobium sp. (strain ORS 278) TaxID=114615 RepID=UPI0001508965|nr:cytochrome c [Bradyrhizobium sp. ORS 278]CAL76960.1 putative alcohol dehydrogenase cytochrome c subunit protein [Bradyrhizobium sp. ORS 278]
MSLSKRFGLALLTLLVILGAAALAMTWRPAIAAIDPPSAKAFDPALVKRGRQLAAIGNCADCHTFKGGKDFAGGLPVATPFGTIFSTNITPDPDTGIGRWSEAAFQRAMASGIDRAGQHLYPTFPYDHFTHVSPEDNSALYAYLMTREPVHVAPPDNHLTFPFNVRPILAGWKLLFLRRGEVTPDPARSAAWNRGQYLVEGLAHCGACHTPRNALGAERKAASFGGGEADNWQAYALNAQSPAPVPWTGDALLDYLRHGWQRDHGVARGPMAQVVNNLASVDADDVRAIATYTADIFGPPRDRSRRPEAGVADAAASQSKPPAGLPQASVSTANTGSAPSNNADGAAIYAAACANCHESARPLPYGGIDLHRSTGISAPDARNVANTVLYGLPPRDGERSPIMPGFAASLTDAQASALLAFLRARFSTQPPWSHLDQTLAGARRAQASFLRTAAEPPNISITGTTRGQP